MTAEAVVMNKNAVAIAADSAVTVTTGMGSGTKIWNTVNKLFNISRIAPVAGMVYGNAEFSGFPWETLMKSHRRHLADKTFATINEYAEDFISYLHTTVSSCEIDEFDFAQIIMGHFHSLNIFVRRKLGEVDANTLGEDLPTSIQDAIKEYEQILEGMNDVESLADLDQNQVIWHYRRDIFRMRKLAVDEFFGDNLTREARRSLWRIAYLSCVKEVYSVNSSGLVIAGFGEAEIFPHLKEYMVDGVICGKIKYKMKRESDIDHNMQAVIMPFAQSDMVYQFMEGVDRDYKLTCGKMFRDVMNLLVEACVSKYVRSKKKQKTVLEEMRQVTEAIQEGMEKKLDSHRRENFARPVIAAVRTLPKEEMAMLAESLVQLTSLKRRVSTELETVGEPIDVAVISKGDGFIWIKRKHYFRPELNPRFIQNYPRR